MRQKIKITVAVLLVVLYGQANYIIGYDQGADTTLCVTNYTMFKERHRACDRVWTNTPMAWGTRAWRVLSNDAVPESAFKKK